MAKSVPRVKPNQESVALFENANSPRAPKNIPGLKSIYEEEWNEIPTKICKSLIENYKKRLVAVEGNNGYSTNY